MVRFIHTSDWHIYDKHKYSSEGERLKELVANCAEIIEGAASAEADRLIIAGDIFHHYNPSERLLSQFAALMTRAISLGVRVRIIIGQHDTNGTDFSLQSLMFYLNEMYGKMGLDISDEYLKVYPSGEVFHEHMENTNFWYVSWAKDTEQLIKSIRPFKDEWNVLVAHTGILGARTPSGHMMRRGYMAAKDLAAFDYVAMGDFHNYQNVTGNIYYSGAPIRFRWDERDNDLGYNLVEIEERVDVSRIPLVDIEMIETEMNAGDIDEDVLVEVDGKKVEGAIIKVNVKGNLTDTKRIQLKTGLYEAGARQVCVKSQKEVIALSGDTEQTSGLSIIEMIKRQKLEKPIEEYGIEIATQI